MIYLPIHKIIHVVCELHILLVVTEKHIIEINVEVLSFMTAFISILTF